MGQFLVFMIICNMILEFPVLFVLIFSYKYDIWTFVVDGNSSIAIKKRDRIFARPYYPVSSAIAHWICMTYNQHRN
jgi:hypothetical protein